MVNISIIKTVVKLLEYKALIITAKLLECETQ